MYTIYCGNQPDALGTLQKLKDNEELQSFLKVFIFFIYFFKETTFLLSSESSRASRRRSHATFL